MKEITAKYNVLQRQPFPDFYKKDPFKNFLKLTKKHLYQSLYLMKLLVSNLQLYRQREADTGVFL